MTEHLIEHGRRRAIKLALGTIVAIPLANILVRSPAEAADVLSPSSVQARQLQYTQESLKPKEMCINCSYYGGSGDQAPCSIFSGKLVYGTGWCTSWMAG